MRGTSKFTDPRMKISFLFIYNVDDTTVKFTKRVVQIFANYFFALFYGSSVKTV